jgi:Holliday junction resolvase RusA-like endonuclease
MSESVIIQLDGPPVAKARPRFGKGHVYTPARTKRFERDLGWTAKAQMVGRKPFDAPIKIGVVFDLALESFSQADIDNLCKAALDALNGIVWRDDAQVIELCVRKQVSDKPLTWIQVSPLTEWGSMWSKPFHRPELLFSKAGSTS